MYILYTHESIVVGTNQEDLDAVLADLNKVNLEVTVEETL